MSLALVLHSHSIVAGWVGRDPRSCAPRTTIRSSIHSCRDPATNEATTKLKHWHKESQTKASLLVDTSGGAAVPSRSDPSRHRCFRQPPGTIPTSLGVLHIEDHVYPIAIFDWFPLPTLHQFISSRYPLIPESRGLCFASS